MIKIILCSCFLITCILSIKIFIQGARVLGVVMSTLSLVALFFVIYPDYSNLVAHYVGVGRGADLVTYVLFGIVFIGLSFFIRAYLTISEEITILTRHIALNSAKDIIPTKADIDAIDN